MLPLRHNVANKVAIEYVPAPEFGDNMICLSHLISSSIRINNHSLPSITFKFKRKNAFEAKQPNDNNPKYKSMKDLNLKDYKPIFSRKHLESTDPTQLNITLTQEETETFSEIKKAISNRSIFPKPVIVRCAGGWIRDKLLRCDSDDIDLAIDTMTGEEFGECLQQYFALIKNEELHIGKIEKNPSKSKHLASVTFKIGSIEFDVVNLRTERYTDDSRVPIMAFGTASEDAFRRDLTINALFYNMNNGLIEDLTGKGISDMISGIARTPLNAMITYGDDPLRVLRNIRHGITKLGFILDDDIVIAAQNKEIHKLLETKVSRERFAVEFEKMLSGYNVYNAMHCLIKFELTLILFKMPSKKEIKEMDDIFDINNAWKQSLDLTQNITEIILSSVEQKVDNSYDLTTCFGVERNKGKEIQKVLLLAAFMYPFDGIKCKKKKKTQSLVMYFMMNSIPGMKNATKLAETIDIYHNGTRVFVDLLLMIRRDVVSNDKLSLQIGRFLRLTKQDWKYCILLIKSVCSVYYKEIELKSIDELVQWIMTKSSLINCWKWKPLLNGKQLLQKYKEYGLRQDLRIGKINDFILEERLSKPSITIDDLNDKIIIWLKNNAAPPQRSNKKSNKKNKNKRNK